MTEFEFNHAGNSEVQQKLATAYLFNQSALGYAAAGVLAGLSVSQTTTASGSVVAYPGAGIVQASGIAGASLLVNDTNKTIDVFTANPVGTLPRNDMIVFDSATASLKVIVGTANATPADPTVPYSALLLARLRHAANATTIPAAKIDNLIVSTTLAGVILPVPSLYVRDRLPSYDGQQIYRTDLHHVETFQNGAWAITATQVDTGWINPGFTAAAGFTIMSQSARYLNGVVSVLLQMKTTNAIAAGNITNQTMLYLPPFWGPAQSNGALGGGPSGGSHSSYASSSNAIIMTATSGGFPAGSVFYVLGVWMD